MQDDCNNSQERCEADIDAAAQALVRTISRSFLVIILVVSAIMWLLFRG